MGNADQEGFPTNGCLFDETDEASPKPARGAGAGRMSSVRSRTVSASLARTIEREIVPRLVRTMLGRETSMLGPDDVLRLVRALLRDRSDEARNMLHEFVAKGMTVDRIQLELLGPAARRLGELWEADECAFTDVALGVGELQRLMRDFRASLPVEHGSDGRRRRILLAATPGEQHTFGVEMVAEFFVSAGWEVTCRPSATHAELIRVATRDWYDMAGLSISGDRFAGALSDAIRGLRQVSFNPNLVIMVGGPAVGRIEELAERVGADLAVRDAREAVDEAKRLKAR